MKENVFRYMKKIPRILLSTEKKSQIVAGVCATFKCIILAYEVSWLNTTTKFHHVKNLLNFDGYWYAIPNILSFFGWRGISEELCGWAIALLVGFTRYMAKGVVPGRGLVHYCMLKYCARCHKFSIFIHKVVIKQLPNDSSCLSNNISLKKI